MKVNWNFPREGEEGGAKQKTFHRGIFSRTVQFPIKKISQASAPILCRLNVF